MEQTALIDINVMKTFDRQLINLESHQLVWLTSKHIQNQITVETLRNLIDYTKLFDNNQLCAEYLKKSKEIFTSIIISDHSHENFFSSINDLDQVLGVYIHNINNEKYSFNCGKVSTSIDEYARK